MVSTSIKIPKSPDSELYYDSNELRVSFRSKSKKPNLELSSTVLRVVVQVFGNVVEDRFFARNTPIQFGSSRKSALRVALRGLQDPFKLIQYEDTGHMRLSISKDMTGVIQTNDKLQKLEDFESSTSEEGKSIYLPPGSRGVIQIEHVLIYFEEIADPEKLPPISIFKHLSDPQLLRWVAFSVALHLLLLLFLKFLPPGFFSFGRPPVMDKAEKGLAITLDPKKFPPFKPMTKVGQMISRGQQGREGEGARAAGEEGRRGGGKQGRTGGGKLSKKDINKSGVLDFFNKGGSKSVFGDLLGGNSGISGAVQNLGMAPAESGIQGATNKRYGKGLNGTGSGGGNKTATIGEGFGTTNRGGRGAQGTGIADFGNGRSNVPVSAQIPDDEIVISGTLSKDEIARIINNKMGQIKFCYEKELVKSPNLRGKIVANFIIGLEGSVTRSVIKQSTMGDANVESCINSVMRSLKFPKPGGGTVEVFYPFVFRVAG